MHPKLSYRADVDGLRALAILPVLLYHAFPGKLPGGFAGVDIFFVISGFLISGILQRGLQDGSFSVSDFYAHRVRRIVPALLLVLCTCLAFGWFELLPAEFAQLRRHAAAGVGFVQNFVLWGEASYFDTATELKPLMHLWSLSIEEQFYLAYPLLLWGLWRTRWRPVLALALLAALSFGLNIFVAGGDPVQDFFAPHTRAWELLAGACLAASGVAGQVRGRELLAALGLALLAASFGLLHAGAAFPGWGALLPVGGALALLAAGPQAWINRRLLAHPVLVFIGVISYPLYLWHWPLLSFAHIADGLPPIERNAALILSFVLAWLTWRWLEKPLRYGAAGALKTTALCTGLLLAGAFALWPPAQDAERHTAMRSFLAANQDNAPKPQSCAALAGAAHAEDWCGAPVARPAMVLLGDSFAYSFAPMFGPDTAQFARGQCPALLDYGPQYCRAIARAQAAYVAATPSVRTVTLASHWPAYDGGMRWPRIGYREDTASFRAALRRTVEHYQGLGKQVRVLLAPPTGANPATCVPRPVHFDPRGICQRSLEQARASDGAYRSDVLPYLAQRGVAVFDPFPALCKASGCLLRDGEHMLYADWIHLSPYGARWLARQTASGGSANGLD